MSTLWNWPELCQALNLREVGGPDVTGISIDSRSLSTGELFVALTAERDGHEFIDAAMQSGAAGALVSREVTGALPMLMVNDTLVGLTLIAAAARRRMTGQVVAITGSSGKTTMRTWLQQLLADQDSTHGSVGSFNNHWGVPVSLARMPADVRFGVFEIGTNHPGEIEPLSRLVEPDIAVVLNVLPAHVGNFDNIEALRAEKLSIGAGLGANGQLVVHDALANHAASAISFGFSAKADVRGELKGQRLNIQVGGEALTGKFAVGGQHRALTALACMAVIECLGADVERAMSQLKHLVAPRGRGNHMDQGGVRIIDDSYNANPMSMRYALESLMETPSGKRIAILGEMLELGADARALHESLVPLLSDLDGFITVGSGFASVAERGLPQQIDHCETAADIDLEILGGLLDPGDSVLVKGSNKVFWQQGFVDALASAIA